MHRQHTFYITTLSLILMWTYKCVQCVYTYIRSNFAKNKLAFLLKTYYKSCRRLIMIYLINWEHNLIHKSIWNRTSLFTRQHITCGTFVSIELMLILIIWKHLFFEIENIVIVRIEASNYLQRGFYKVCNRPCISQFNMYAVVYIHKCEIPESEY